MLQRQQLRATPLAVVVALPVPAIDMKKYLFAGLLVWTPLVITVAVLGWLVGSLDGMFIGTLYKMRPLIDAATIEWLARVPGFGVILMILILLVTGALVSNVIGRWWVKQWDKLFTHIPFVKSIYTSVKKVSDTLFSEGGNAFRKAVMIEYPHAGMWTIAFQTGVPTGEVAQLLQGQGEYMSVYVPTTPNPTSGYFLLVPCRDVIELELSVDEALTYVISMGAVSPGAPSIEKRN